MGPGRFGGLIGAGFLALGCLLLGCVDLARPYELGPLAVARPMDASSIDEDAPTLAPDAGDAPAIDADDNAQDAPVIGSDGRDDATAANGQTCTDGSGCSSGFCSRGVCCNEACTGTCRSCGRPGSLGVCTLVLAGTDPENDCASEVASGCGHDGTCDGMGACRLYLEGATCTAAHCEGGTATSAGTCDGAGICRPGSAAACTPFACAGTTCASACVADGECGANTFCQGGACLPRAAAGALCVRAAQCASGFCVDGVCCDGACSLSCQACNVTGKVGTCSPVAAGEDPTDDCPTDPAGSCARDGTCDGAGGCRRYVAGTECAPGSCAAGIERAASTCDGNGTCRIGGSRTCNPKVCVGASCGASCTVSSTCQTGFYCNGGKCAVKYAAGTACTQAVECAAGFCVDGVCCGSICDQTCFSCNVTGAAGICNPVPSGLDPRQSCPAELPATCGRAGGCDGAGACRRHGSAVVCAAQSCTASLETSTSQCNGAGACVAGATRACSPYLCGAGGCLTTCTTDTQCQTGFVCAASRCVLAGRLLHWRFDEGSGAVALDDSGNARNGTYGGATGAPTLSTDHAPVMFSDPASRAFVRRSSQYVLLANTPAELRPANNFTLSVWFKATTVDTNGADIVNHGNDYAIRVKTTDVEFVRRGTTGSTAVVAPVTTHLDGKWHHLVAVSSTAVSKLFVDGVLVVAKNAVPDVVYMETNLYVGRNADNDNTLDFEGNIDDVRIYGRPLSDAEVARLAQGGD